MGGCGEEITKWERTDLARRFPPQLVHCHSALRLDSPFPPRPYLTRFFFFIPRPLNLPMGLDYVRSMILTVFNSLDRATVVVQ
jgi:hypothetical protein